MPSNRQTKDSEFKACLTYMSHNNIKHEGNWNGSWQAHLSFGLFKPPKPILAHTRPAIAHSVFPGRSRVRFRRQISAVGVTTSHPTHTLWAGLRQAHAPETAGDRKCRGVANRSRQPALALRLGARAGARSFPRPAAYSSDGRAGAVT